uniref:Cell division protein ftsZ, putative n=1 Tax=Arundo donax TaxID=35708 RepID=A0A0A9ETF8_ARUDO
MEVKERVFLLKRVSAAGACTAPEVTVTQGSHTSDQCPSRCSIATQSFISPTRRWWTELCETR